MSTRLDNDRMSTASDTMRHTPMLRVRELTVTFGPVTALDRLHLTVDEGEIVGVAGDNGAGKTTLLRCVSGDLGEGGGHVWVDGVPVSGAGLRAHRRRLGVVWQDLALPDNLDVGAAVMLGKERRRLLTSEARTHADAREALHDLGVPIDDTSRQVSSLSIAERQLLAIVRAASPRPRMLLLDEPTAVLSRVDSAHVESLIRRFRDEGTTIVLVSHDIEQLFRLTDRIVVMRHGRVVADVDPVKSHTDEVVALMAGLDAASAPRRQLSRLGGLADQLTASDHPGNLTLILSTLGAALGARQLSLHLLEQGTLRCVASVGLAPRLDEVLRVVPVDDTMLPIVHAAEQGELIAAAVDLDATQHADALTSAGVHGWWAVPFSAGTGLTGVISVFRPTADRPGHDEESLINLYAGYAATTVERERLVAELTARNRVLEAIREVLQTLAGPASLTEGVGVALGTLREALEADEVVLHERDADGIPSPKAYAVGPGLAGDVGEAGDDRDRHAVPLSDGLTLTATWSTRRADRHERTLLEDAGHSILLALDRQRAEEARRETAALRRSQELQRQFLARLSHELRTPLTAIRGYASSLLQTDVTWDESSRHRFLSRISSESTRLRRLVDDLLDFSLIESGMLRVRPDWVELPLVIDAARACLAPEAAASVSCEYPEDLPVLWADHDRLEQMMMNLLDNAVRHNPPGTSVVVRVRPDGADVMIDVTDDGAGFTRDAAEGDRPDGRSSSGGAGLGLSITRGIVEAHRGSIDRQDLDRGTRFTIRLPVEEESLKSDSVDV